jgi:hypothetical protein
MVVSVTPKRRFAGNHIKDAFYAAKPEKRYWQTA